VADGQALLILAEKNYRLLPYEGTLVFGGDAMAAIIKLDDLSILHQIEWRGNVTGGSDQSFGLINVPTATFTDCSIKNGITPLKYVFASTLVRTQSYLT
jgi:hypothetical protein